MFEGFFNYLSYQTIYLKKIPTLTNFLVLNSLSFFKKAMPVMEQYKEAFLYLDRDKAGQNYSAYALSLGSRYIDKSLLYKGYKDLNEWLVNSNFGSG